MTALAEPRVRGKGKGKGKAKGLRRQRREEPAGVLQAWVSESVLEPAWES